MAQRTISILGATGSIGRSTADVVTEHRELFAVGAVAGGSDPVALAAMAKRLGARFAALADESKGGELRAELSGSGIVSGAAGLASTHAAIKLGRAVALANKESLVCAGDAMMRDAKRYGATLLPVDSEHNALQQALGDGRPDDVAKMTLTASGGPFRTWPAERIAAATYEEAAAHP